MVFSRNVLLEFNVLSVPELHSRRWSSSVLYKTFLSTLMKILFLLEDIYSFNCIAYFEDFLVFEKK